MSNFFRFPFSAIALSAILFPCVLVSQEKKEQPAPSSNQIPALEISEVPKETKLIEEKGLRLNSAVGAQLQHSPAQGGLYTPSNQGLAPNPMSGSMLEAPSDRDNSLPNATRVFAFWLDAGESILIRRTAEDESGISMRLVQPTMQHPLSPQILRVNRMPQPLRSKRIEFKNTTTESFKVVLLVYGRTGIPYKLEIVRKPN